MKKLKGFNVAALKQFLVQNVEKIVFGVSMFLVALFVYSAISQQAYQKTPEQLRQGIQAAQTNMQKIIDIPKPDVPQPPRFVEVAQRATDEVPASAFPTPLPWGTNKSLHIGSKRGEPAFLAVRELEVETGAGPLALRDPDITKRFVNAIQQQQLNQDGQIVPGGRPGMPARRRHAPKRPTGNKNTRGNLLNAFLGQDGGGEGAIPGGGEGGVGPMAATGGTGIARGVQAPPESMVEGHRWACITGLVPYREQLELYRKEFETAQHQDPSKDSPYWMGMLVERAEITTPEELRDPSLSKWTSISYFAAWDFTKLWAARAGEVVDPAYTDPNLTFPLPPLLERNWGKEAAHSKIPALDVSQRMATSGDTTGVVEGPTAIAAVVEKTEGSDLEAMLKRRQNRGIMSPDGSGMPQRTPAARAPVSRGMPGGGGYGEGGGYPMRSPRGFPGADGGEGVAYATGAETPEELEFLLFRFFDFTVEEGKRYRYRVQLVLDNPNYQIRPQYLKDAKLAKEELRKSPFSEPSPVASVTGYNELLAGPVKAAEKAIDEPKANLIAVQLDPKLGTKATYEMRGMRPKEKREMLPVNRGQLIKFTAKVDVVHPITRKVEEQSIAFNANKVVIDMRGGEMFNASNYKDRDTFPGEVLLMDANGELSSRSEAADEQDYLAESDWLFALEEAKKNNAQAPFGGFPGGFPGDGGDGGDGGGGLQFRPGRRGSGS